MTEAQAETRSGTAELLDSGTSHTVRVQLARDRAVRRPAAGQSVQDAALRRPGARREEAGTGRYAKHVGHAASYADAV